MLLNEMEIFYYVVELQSFSKAADYLRVSKSFISKHITKLEQDLKTRLLTRTTRELLLTEAGQAFYTHCVKVVAEASKGYGILSELGGKPSGKLKISIPPALALNLLPPMLVNFARLYPDVILDIQLENQLIDIIKGGYDLAIRSAVLQSSNLIAQKISSSKNVLCATPTYFRHYGMPKIPVDLTQHNFAIYNYSKQARHIKLTKNKREEIVYIQGNFMANQMDLSKHMVLSHLCIAALPEFVVQKELKNRKLVSCLTDYQLPIGEFYAVYPERDFMPLKVKVFITMLKEFLAGG